MCICWIARPLDDAKAGAQKLIALLENEVVWQTMSRAARQRYLTRFSPDVLGRRWMDELIGPDS